MHRQNAQTVFNVIQIRRQNTHYTHTLGNSLNNISWFYLSNIRVTKNIRDMNGFSHL